LDIFFDKNRPQNPKKTSKVTEKQKRTQNAA